MKIPKMMCYTYPYFLQNKWSYVEILGQNQKLRETVCNPVGPNQKDVV
jgi:hypothetical protein